MTEPLDIRCAEDDLAADSRPAEETGPRIRIFPDVFISALTTIVVALLVYSVLCIFWPATLGVRANPLAAPVELKPAWYFLFLYRLLGDAPPLLRALTPTLLLVLLGAWPFLDRSPGREPRARVAGLALAAVVAVALVVLTYFGWRA